MVAGAVAAVLVVLAAVAVIWALRCFREIVVTNGTYMDMVTGSDKATTFHAVLALYRAGAVLGFVVLLNPPRPGSAWFVGALAAPGILVIPTLVMVLRYAKRSSGPMVLSMALVALLTAGGDSGSIGASRATTRGGGRAVSFQVVSGWPTLPSGEILGQATGVGVDSHGNVLVFHRAGRVWAAPPPTEPIARPTVWVFDGTTGQFLRSWGAGMFVMPHGLTVDRDDNVWLTDVGLHQVFKFSPDGGLLLTLGEAGKPGADAGHFNLPTDVAVLRDGSVLVSDGYQNTRIAKVRADGTFLLAWGAPGTGPGQFDLPHGIDADASGHVFVADRGNSRVQVFDSDGLFLAEWRGPEVGRPYAVAISAGGKAFVADGGDQPTGPPDRSGVAVLDHEGKVLTRFGRFGNYDGQFRLAHDVAVGRDGAVYVVDAWGQRVQKFVPR